METLIEKLRIPFILVLILFVLFLMLHLTEAYGNYWMGRYYKKQVNG